MVPRKVYAYRAESSDRCTYLFNIILSYNFKRKQINNKFDTIETQPQHIEL